MCGGDMRLAPAMKPFAGHYGGLQAQDEGKSLLFFLSYAQKVGVPYSTPAPKSGGTHTPVLPINNAYVTHCQKPSGGLGHASKS